MGGSISRDWIILDIDGTLVSIDKDKHFSSSIELVVNSKKMWINIRPGVPEFLNFCLKNYNVGIWSFGTKEYVYKVVDILFQNDKPKFVKTCNNYFKYKNSMYKSLKMCPSKKCLLIEDNIKYVLEEDKKKTILVPSFYTYSPNDETMYQLIKILNFRKGKINTPLFYS